jgi:hypothetical protein
MVKVYNMVGRGLKRYLLDTSKTIIVGFRFTTRQCLPHGNVVTFNMLKNDVLLWLTSATDNLNKELRCLIHKAHLRC